MSMNRTVTRARVARRRLTIEPDRPTGNPVTKPSARTRVVRIFRRVHRATRQGSR
jgi:hypothetical protein